jgi:streptogramin lyase
VTTTGGLARFRQGKFETFTQQNGLSSDVLGAAYEDREGSLWLATAGGLNRLKDSQLAVCGLPEGLGDDFVWSVCQSRDGSMWIGTNSEGLWHLKNGRFTAYTTKEGLSNNTVRGLHEDREGNLWIAGYGGVCRFRDGRFTTYTTRDGLTSDTVFAVYQDQAGTVWAGTRAGGLCALRNGKWTVYPPGQGLPNESVRSITEDCAGALWAATEGGLVRYADGRFTTFSTHDGLRCARLLGVTADAQGNIWAASDGGGLVRWRQGRITSYGIEEGLGDDVIYQVLDDGAGSLWLGSNKGIFRVAKKELDDMDAGKAVSVAPVLFANADGMRSTECNGGNQSAGCRTRNGQLWFTTMRGLVIVEAQKLTPESTAPPVVLEQVLVNREPIDASSPAELAPGKSELEFHYTALSFLAPERLRFRYLLEGYDREWVDAGTRREAYYTNLAPGEYRFRVQARSGRGDWGETESVFSFRLLPSFYQTWWFFTVCALAAAGLGVGAHKVRVRLLESREESLQRRVAERTQELRQAQEAAWCAKERAEAALAQVKQLRGLLPMCAYCKKIRDDGDYWHQLEVYLSDHSDARVSHGICPDCWGNVAQPMLDQLKPTADTVPMQATDRL